VDLHYRDEQFLDGTLKSDVAQEAYTKINGQLALNRGPWTMALVGKNLTDEDYNTFGINFASLGPITQQYGEGVSYGLDVTYEF